jgi:hypothetical protein
MIAPVRMVVSRTSVTLTTFALVGTMSAVADDKSADTQSVASPNWEHVRVIAESLGIPRGVVRGVAIAIGRDR